MNNLVSIVIPAYNAEPFIKDTIKSVLNQTYDNWELIVVNDGSIDKTLEIIKSFNDIRIKIINQTNSGVSVARNNGMNISMGDFIVFLDADDIFSENFIEKRLICLLSNQNIGFCCSEVFHFKNNVNEIIEKKIGTFENIEENILLYNKGFDSVPSNYMFRKSVLKQNNICFDKRLSSTADRLFLLELNKFTIGKFVENAPLYYRISENSMSNKFNKKLVDDNILYLRILKEKKLIPPSLKNEVYIIHSYIFGTACLKLKRLCFIEWYIKGLFINPLRFFKIIFTKLQNKS